MAVPVLLPNRGFLRLRGADKHFLQGIISQDIELLQTQPAIYSCLLTPQGKFLHDFFVINLGDDWLIDGEADRIEDLQKRLVQFRMRHKVEITNETAQWQVIAKLNYLFEQHMLSSQRKLGSSLSNNQVRLNPSLHWDDASVAASSDPRHVEMGQRVYLPKEVALPSTSEFLSYDQQRIKLAIPDGSRDMVLEQALPMEFRLHALNGISLSKGCYLGQEMCSRMFFRDLLKRQSYTLQFAGEAPSAGTVIRNAAGQMVGEVRSRIGGLALALIKIEIAEAEVPITLMADSQNCQILI